MAAILGQVMADVKHCLKRVEQLIKLSPDVQCFVPVVRSNVKISSEQHSVLGP